MQKKSLVVEGIADKQILSLCLNPDTLNSGFELLLSKYQQQVYWQVRKMVIDHDDSDDLVQEIFIKVWKNLPSFREESKLSTWIYRISVNEVLSFLKKKKKRNLVSLTGVQKQLEQNLQDDPYFNGDKIQEEFQKALLLLPAKQRQVFQLKYYNELKYNEISIILGTSVGALKASYHHAVKKIERYFSDH